MSRIDGLNYSQFQGVYLNDYPIVEDLLLLNIFFYDIDIVERNIIGELARRSVQKHENIFRLLRYNTHKCYVEAIFSLD